MADVDAFEIAARIADAKSDEFANRANLRRKACGGYSATGLQFLEAAQAMADIAMEIRAEGRARRAAAPPVERT